MALLITYIAQPQYSWPQELVLNVGLAGQPR
jgi:hypothetical protein